MSDVREPSFDCPHCGEYVTSIDEVSTVGGIVLPGSTNPPFPHAVCPHCRECMGCPRHDEGL